MYDTIYFLAIHVYSTIVTTVGDFRLPPRCKRNLRSSGMLDRVDCWLVTDISGQTIGHIVTDPPLVLHDGTDSCLETPVTNY